MSLEQLYALFWLVAGGSALCGLLALVFAWAPTIWKALSFWGFGLSLAVIELGVAPELRSVSWEARRAAGIRDMNGVPEYNLETMLQASIGFGIVFLLIILVFGIRKCLVTRHRQT